MEENLSMIFQLSGGLALFLYGMDTMSCALRRSAGAQLKLLLHCLTGNPLLGAAAGALVTALLQSSSAVTVMVIGLVSAELLSLPQAVPVIFGANVGTTVTAQLMAFRIGEMRYLLLFAGLVLYFFSRSGHLHETGTAVFAVGLLFEGVAVMEAATGPLAGSPFFQQWMLRVRSSPVLGLLTGLCMTLVVQSSSATIAVLQNLASKPALDGVHSLLGLEGALPILLGDNVGTTITAVLASLGGSRDAKRVAAAHACFNLSGAVLFGAALPWFVRLVKVVSPKGAELEIIARQIADAHTLFNIGTTLLWLPLTSVMVRLVRKIVF